MAELKWRKKADALFLIGGSEVVSAADDHMVATKERITAANRGYEASGRGTYQRLNDAMRNEILHHPEP